MLAVCMGNSIGHRTVWTATERARERRNARRCVPSREIANSPLGSLDGSGMEGTFHAWIGRSGRRYVFTIAPLRGIDDEALRNAVVMYVEKGRDGRRRPVFIGETDAIPENLLRARTPLEVHYHLLAATPRARLAVIADLFGDE